MTNAPIILTGLYKMETLVINGLRFTDKANLGFLLCKDVKNGIFYFFLSLENVKGVKSKQFEPKH